MSAIQAPPRTYPEGSAAGDKGLKTGALSYVTNIVVGVASTAPAYSIAATLGFIVALKGVGVHAPAVMLVSFVPMFLVALGYKYLNRADPDCGTTFSWTTRAFGPWVGWFNGWAIFVADVLVMASLAVIAAQYTFLLFDWNSGATNHWALAIGATLWIVLMTWICYRGIELSARTQQFLLGAEIAILAAFAVVAIVKSYTSATAHSMHLSLSWFNPFDMSVSALVDGVLLGIFIYWGWDSGVSVNEETEDPAEAPGKAAVVSTVLLLLIYVTVSAAAQAYGGTTILANNSSDVLNVLGQGVFGSPWNKLLIIAVLTSAAASTQTTILPTARTTLSMARWGALPAAFGKIHPRYLTPTVSTIGMGGLSVVWTLLLVLLNPAQDLLGDSVTAIGFAIAFYYGFTGFACAWYFRHELRRSPGVFFRVGFLPFLGGLLMAAIFVKALHDFNAPDYGYAAPIAGIQVPLVIGIGALLLGLPLMVLCWLRLKPFFRRTTEVASPDIVL
ncbi:MAG TPA: APC family permease [Gaiellaceae bacterium]|jgi:amino acid transporter|nr:APC family permease [Gaiellaceae bacterium]